MFPSRSAYLALPLSLLVLQSCDGVKSPEDLSETAAALREAEELDSIDFTRKPCETAFAYSTEGARCFREIFGTPRWGWSIGPLAEGTRTFDLYAGAGQCDLGKGTKVGTASVEIEGGLARVALTAAQGYSFAESHLYLGSTPLPRHAKGGYTVAPGRFPYAHDLNQATYDSYEVTGVPSAANMVLHVVSCGEGGRSSRQPRRSLHPPRSIPWRPRRNRSLFPSPTENPRHRANPWRRETGRSASDHPPESTWDFRAA